MDILDEITRELQVLHIAEEFPVEAMSTPSPREGPHLSYAGHDFLYKE